jgi:predicted DNA binding CopG/RHH family protein
MASIYFDVDKKLLRAIKKKASAEGTTVKHIGTQLFTAWLKPKPKEPERG